MNLRRRKAGSALVESLSIFALVLVVTLFSGDLFWLILGFSENNNVCARASRAASQGAPDQVKKGEPYRRAMAVLSAQKHTAGPIEMPKTLLVSETISQPLPEPEFGGAVNGEVKVTSIMRVHPPFLLSRILGPDGLGLRASKTYSFSYYVGQQKPSI